MPAVSEKQHRAMEAAAHGHSALGIPKAVGEEFVAGDAVNGHAAGILYVAPDGDVLLLRRSSTEENYAGHWALPGGKADGEETPEQTADREAREEMGDVPEGKKRLLDSKITPTGMAFHTFAQPVEEKFVPKLNSEHSGYAWAPLNQLPEPMHPAVKSTLHERLGLGEDLSPEDWGATKSGFAKWASDASIEDRLARLAERRTGAQDSLAMDRDSVRRIDQDGHLFVEMTPISKANVCPYYGREIPDCHALGLDPERMYRLYRDADELAKAAPTFAGKQLLMDHIPVSADDPHREKTIGAVGDDVIFQAPYLMAPLSIWDGEAIALIESGEQRELSSAYRYRADMTPGTVNGESFDGVMRDISGNHVALVREGRAGPDVIVQDSMPNPWRGRFASDQQEPSMAKILLTRKAAVAQGALMTFLAPRLAQDAKIDIAPLLAGVTAKNFKAKRPAIVKGVTSLVTGKLANDAKIDDLAGPGGGLDTLLIALDEVEPDEEDKKAEDDAPKNGLRDFLKGKLSAEDMAACDAMLDDQEAMDEDDDKEKKAEDEEKDDKVDKKAMDAAIDAAKREVRQEMQKTQREIRDAEEVVRPYVGKLAMAHDSADGVFRTALGALGVKDVDKLHPDALKHVLLAQPLPGASIKHAVIATDAKASASFAERFPAAARIKSV